jgi:hypothetical protein
MRELDIWGTARKLVELYGPNAWALAAARAQRRVSDGDTKGARRWMEIAKSVRQLDDRHMRTAGAPAPREFVTPGENVSAASSVATRPVPQQSPQ